MKKIIGLMLSVLILVTTVSVAFNAVAEETDTLVANSYAPGLAAWFDGEMNTANGHDNTAAVWKDLAGGNDLTLNINETNYFTDNGFVLNSQKNYFSSNICSIVNKESFTVEILFGSFTSLGTTFNTIMNSDNDSFALFRRNDSNVIEFKYAQNAAAQRPTVANGLETLNNALLTVTYNVGGDCIIYINGVEAARKSCYSTSGANNLFIGHNDPSKTFEAEYRSIRFYTRDLTLGEVKRNAAVDGVMSVNDLYVSDGLQSLYSGISNTRDGYDADSDIWADLVGENDLTVTLDSSNYFTREGLLLNSSATYFPQNIVDIVKGDEFTVEMRIGKLDGIGTGINQLMGSSNGNFSIFVDKATDELGFRINGSTEYTKAAKGQEHINNGLISVAYDADGNANIYVNGEKIAEGLGKGTVDADDLFFGAQGFDATYRSIRFYNRVLSDEEIKENTDTDCSVDYEFTQNCPRSITVAQPKTNISGDITLVRSLSSISELNEIASYSTKMPAAVIMKVNGELEIVGDNGEVIGKIIPVLEKLNFSSIPVFDVIDGSEDTLAAYLEKLEFYDCYFMSDDAAKVKSFREKCPSVSGVIDYTDVYKNAPLTTEDCLNIRRSMKSNNGTVALLPQSVARKDTVQYLFDRIVNVWVDAVDEPSDTDCLDALLSGAVGVVTDSTSQMLDLASSLPKKTVTRTPLNVGHRGLPSQYPENTLEGAIAAYEAGADVIEIDVYLTTDNEVVIMHDPSTNRTCDGNLWVEGSTLAQLKELYVNKGFETIDGKNQCKIPTLDEFLDYFKGKDCMIFIEIKSGNTNIVSVMRDKIETAEMYGQCSVITFNTPQMAQMRIDYPTMSVGALCNGYLDETDSDLDMRSVMNFIGKYNATLNPSMNGYGEKAARAALFRGISVYPWTFGADNFTGYFTNGYSGLTGNNCNEFVSMLNNVLVNLNDGDIWQRTEDIWQIPISAITYGGVDKGYLSEFAAINILEGEDCATVDGDKLSFIAEGKLTFYVTYYNNQKVGYYMATQPITIDIVDKYTGDFGDLSVSGALTSAGESDDVINIQLFAGHGDDIAPRPAYKTTVTGTGEIQYAVENIVSGKYTLKVTKKGHISEIYEITVGETNAVQNVSMQLSGDVSGDNIVNALDLLLFQQHILHTDTIKIGYADFDSNGVIDAADMVILKAMIIYGA